jgi:hypothetical protein
MMDANDKERLELLAGARSGDKSRAAVRRSDLAPLVKLKPTKVKTETGDTVSVDAFNALVAEFLALRRALDEVTAKVKP